MITHLIHLIKNNMTWDNLRYTLKFYKFNPHSIPGVSHLLCKIGRHDYEAVGLDLKKKYIMLECFYCFHRKNSGLPDHPTKYRLFF